MNTASSGLTPVDVARFQVLDVDEKCDIRSYVQKNGLIFKTGRGFYEFTKPEKISDKKEVVLLDKVRCYKSAWSYNYDISILCPRKQVICSLDQKLVVSLVLEELLV